MKKIKRVLCMLLTCCLVTGMLPMVAYATEIHTDISDWLLSECRFSEEENSFILTEDDTQWDTGSIWYNTPCKDDFTLELDYYTGTGNRRLGGADGIAVAFYADYDYIMTGGEEMGFNGSKGYGIELDTYQNSNREDPNYNHIAMIKESVGNHLVTASLPESEDERWHHLKIVVEYGVCTAYVDGEKKLDHKVEKTGHGWIGITSATGSGENRHAVKNIVISGENTGATDAKYLDMKLSHNKITDGDGQYTYEITANITNTADATAKNMVASLTCDDSFTLAEGFNKEIQIGDLASGENKTVAWKVTAAWPDKSCACVYGVTADIDNASASLWQESYIYLQAKNEYDNSFVFGTDQWNFSNSYDFFDPTHEEDYFLTSDDFKALLDNVNNIERSIIKKVKSEKWVGSCYGMSATAILTKVGVLDVGTLQNGVSDLYHITKTNSDDEIESFINFYFLQQKTNAAQNDRTEFSLKSTKEQLSILEDKLSTVMTGGNPVLLSFSGTNNEGTGWVHAVVAYGVEYKRNDLLDNSLLGWKDGYDARILIYDCNYPDESTYLFFNPGTDSFSFEKYDDAEKLVGACNDINILDAVNYQNATKNQYAMLRFEMSARYFLKWNDSSMWIDGTTDLRDQGIVALYDSAIPADGISGKTGFTLTLPSLDESYTIEPENGQTCQVDLTYENTMLRASVDEADSITFSPNGSITASGTIGEYELALCANEGYYNLPWYLVTVCGENSEEITLKQTDDGIVIAGSDLKNTTVTVESQTEIETLSFSTDEHEVLVKDDVVDTKTVPMVYVDTDNDGMFESPITNDNSDSESNSFGSGSGSSVSSYSVTVDTSTNGTVTVSPKNASKGTTVTITVKPDAGYELDNLTVTDKNGDTVKLTKKGDGKYTFTMPASKITVEATFVPASDARPTQPTAHPFADVATGTWIDTAVQYVYANGLMTGMSETEFAPSAATNRAMIWTILARRSGADTTGGANWYEKGQQWAIETGLMTGNGSGTLAPKAGATRAETAAMLMRFCEANQ